MNSATRAAHGARRSALHAAHQGLRAKFATFGGWEMPLYYTSIMKEHRAVRTCGGLFDVSHLGVVDIEGPSAERFLQQVMTQDLSRLVEGQATYTPMCNAQGGILDEMILYRLGVQQFRLVVNAGNAEKDLAWLHEHAVAGVAVRDLRQPYGILAIQGPKAQAIVEPLAHAPLADLPYYHCRPGVVCDRPAVIARTGYTGEDGFELILKMEALATVWDAALTAGRPVGMLPAGLGARDTLRLEAGMPLYGNDIDETTTPFEVGIGRTVAFQKPEFIGRSALWRQSQEGVRRRLIGFVMEEPGVARPGCALARHGQPVGQVTSGTYSPTLARNIGLGYAAVEASAPGTALSVVIRERPTKAAVVKLPFYTRHGRS